MQNADATAVAQWMVDQIERDGSLYQEEAVDAIAEKFGEAFTYLNDAGNPAIARTVLAAFRRLTEQTVVWERSERCWRKREPDDGPGRSQE